MAGDRARQRDCDPKTKEVLKSPVMPSTLTTATFTPVDRVRLNPRGDYPDHDGIDIHQCGDQCRAGTDAYQQTRCSSPNLYGVWRHPLREVRCFRSVR